MKNEKEYFYFRFATGLIFSLGNSAIHMLGILFMSSVQYTGLVTLSLRTRVGRFMNKYLLVI